MMEQNNTTLWDAFQPLGKKDQMKTLMHFCQTLHQEFDATGARGQPPNQEDVRNVLQCSVLLDATAKKIMTKGVRGVTGIHQNMLLTIKFSAESPPKAPATNLRPPPLAGPPQRVRALAAPPRVAGPADLVQDQISRLRQQIAAEPLANRQQAYNEACDAHSRTQAAVREVSTKLKAKENDIKTLPDDAWEAKGAAFEERGKLATLLKAKQTRMQAAHAKVDTAYGKLQQTKDEVKRLQAEIARITRSAAAAPPAATQDETAKSDDDEEEEYAQPEETQVFLYDTDDEDEPWKRMRHGERIKYIKELVKKKKAKWGEYASFDDKFNPLDAASQMDRQGTKDFLDWYYGPSPTKKKARRE